MSICRRTAITIAAVQPGELSAILPLHPLRTAKKDEYRTVDRGRSSRRSVMMPLEKGREGGRRPRGGMIIDYLNFETWRRGTWGAAWRGRGMA